MKPKITIRVRNGDTQWHRVLCHQGRADGEIRFDETTQNQLLLTIGKHLRLNSTESYTRIVRTSAEAIHILQEIIIRQTPTYDPFNL